MIGSVSLPRGRIARRCWPVLLLLLPAGCSSKGTVSGTVTYQGKPVAAGTVTFVPQKGGGAFTASIREGKYKVEGVPTGAMKIAVSTPSPAPGINQFIGKMQPPPELRAKMAPNPSGEGSAQPSVPATEPIPRKFEDPETSGLTYTVKSGVQVHDIDLPAS